MTNTKNNIKPSLEVRDLGKRYGENAWVISGLNHHFEAGTATGLVGPNGAGKTTFLRMISGAAFPTAGNVFFNEFDIHKHVHRYLSNVGIVSDIGDMPQFLSAEELVEAIMRNRGIWQEKSSAAEMKKLFELVELDDRRTGLIGTYSSGMMQKTMIAAALAGKPSVLLLDEPFRALDESAVSSVMDILKNYVAEGNIVLISSHQRAYLDELCTDFVEFPHLK